MTQKTDPKRVLRLIHTNPVSFDRAVQWVITNNAARPKDKRVFAAAAKNLEAGGPLDLHVRNILKIKLANYADVLPVQAVRPVSRKIKRRKKSAAHPTSNSKQSTKKHKAELVMAGRFKLLVFKMQFPDRETLREIQKFDYRILHKKGRTSYWTAPVIEENCDRLLEIKERFELHEDLRAELAHHQRRKDELENGIAYEPIHDIPKFGFDLKPFQAAGVGFIESRKGRALLADDMGLGKTIQALGYAALHRKENFPMLIICPSPLKRNWRKEAAKAFKGKVRIELLSGLTPYRPHKRSMVLIINYDILAPSRGQEGWARYLAEVVKPKFVVIDESHHLKNMKAQRTKAGIKLADAVPRLLCMTGTPVTNRAEELYPTFRMVDPELFPNHRNFKMNYCGGAMGAHGMEAKETHQSRALHEILTKTIMLRRLKKDVLKELPEKQRSVIPLEIKNRKEYDKANNDFLEWLEQNYDAEHVDRATNAQALVKANKLKRLAVDGKLDQICEWVRGYLEQEEKLVLFAWHTEVIKTLLNKFPGAVGLFGDMNNQQREEAKERFQHNKQCRLIVCNLKVGSTGHTLTAAHATAHAEFSWVPADHDQAEDRVHRIGQEADSVEAYYLIAENTIDEQIVNLLDEKRKLIGEVVDGKLPTSSSLVGELLKGMKEARNDQ